MNTVTAQAGRGQQPENDGVTAGTSAKKPLGHSAALVMTVASFFAFGAWSVFKWISQALDDAETVCFVFSITACVFCLWSQILAFRSCAGPERSRLARLVLYLPQVLFLYLGLFRGNIYVSVLLQMPVALLFWMTVRARLEDPPRFVLVGSTLYGMSVLLLWLSLMFPTTFFL
ncbi:MAG: hypothetical protein HY291_20280 [Planctomycetes bacterium]|nr:hypothetical protein [Planctomycetota bacterium]